MNLTSSQEEYLKIIYILENNIGKVRVTDIAKKLKITKPSVNRAVKNLREINLIEYEVYGEIKLTEQGKKIAKEIIKKQDIIKIFLTEVLEINEVNAEEEAKAMKHAISPNTIKQLESYITKIMNLGELECDYDKNSPKCQNCIKISIKNRMNKK